MWHWNSQKLFWNFSITLFTPKKLKNNISLSCDEWYWFIYCKSVRFNFIHSSPNYPNNSHNPRWFFLFTILRLGLSHLKQYRFKQTFQDSINPLCGCGNNVEFVEHFLLQCSQFVNEKRTLLSNIGTLNLNLLQNTLIVLTQTLLFGNIHLI